jgi:hypothetical protein
LDSVRRLLKLHQVLKLILAAYCCIMGVCCWKSAGVFMVAGYLTPDRRGATQRHDGVQEW